MLAANITPVPRGLVKINLSPTFGSFDLKLLGLIPLMQNPTCNSSPSLVCPPFNLIL